MSNLDGLQRRVAEQSLVLGADTSTSTRTRTQQGKPETQATSPTSVNALTTNSDSQQNRRLSTESVLEGKENAGTDDESQAKPTSGHTESSPETQDDEAVSDGTDIDIYEVVQPSRLLETRKKAAPKRVRQHFEYIKLMEDRMQFLEKKVKILSKEPEQPPESVPPPSLILSSCEMTWSEFKSPSARKHVIDVLLGDPHVDMRRTRFHSQISHAMSRHLSVETVAFQPRLSQDVSEIRSLLPERIRINSSLVIKILTKITAVPIDVEHFVILRPFKLLINYDREIREFLDGLEEKWKGITLTHTEASGSNTTKPAHNGNTAANSSRGQGGRDAEMASDSLGSQNVAGVTDDGDLEDLSSDSEAALKRLRVLVRFMDHYIDLPVKKLVNDPSPNVYFADLWHLFKPGEEIYWPAARFQGGQIQAFRIIHTSGGRKYLMGVEPEDSKNSNEDWDSYHEKISPFTVTCVYVTFDGKEFSGVQTSFEIREYARTRLITSLFPCPLKYAENSALLKRELRERGKRYLELVQEKHNHYTGLTKEPMEEIDSQIIVDFATTFQNNATWAPDFSSRFPTLSDRRETIESSVKMNLCVQPGCCNNDYIHQDGSLDQKRMMELLTTYPISRKDVRVVIKPTGASTDEVILEEDDMLLLPGHVFGFVLRSRTWGMMRSETPYIKQRLTIV